MSAAAAASSGAIDLKALTATSARAGGFNFDLAVEIGDVSGAIAICRSFMKNVPALHVTELKAYHTAQKWDQLSRVAHTIKGDASMIGADRLTELATRLYASSDFKTAPKQQPTGKAGSATAAAAAATAAAGPSAAVAASYPVLIAAIADEVTAVCDAMAAYLKANHPNE